MKAVHWPGSGTALQARSARSWLYDLEALTSEPHLALPSDVAQCVAHTVLVRWDEVVCRQAFVAC